LPKVWWLRFFGTQCSSAVAKDSKHELSVFVTINDVRTKFPRFSTKLLKLNAATLYLNRGIEQRYF